jgi:hypothetical protein
VGVDRERDSRVALFGGLADVCRDRSSRTVHRHRTRTPIRSGGRGHLAVISDPGARDFPPDRQTGSRRS